MALDFNALKKSRQSEFEKLTQEVNKLATPQQSSNDDDRFWYPAVDKAGNGYAVIRFLPAAEGEDVPFVRIWDHGFKGPSGQWYIEKSLTTLGEKDPVSEYNTELWNNGTESGKEQARQQKRRLTYISNVYIVRDSANPENEGKVMLFKFGKKIWDKINTAMNPQYEDEKPVNPFDLWEGANFKVKIRNVEGYRNYDQSSFDAAAPLFEDDSELEKVWRQEYALQPFIARKEFKTYDELKAKLNRVLGLGATTAANSNQTPWEEQTKPAPQAKTQAPKSQPTLEDDDDESMEFFKKLAAEE